MNPSPRHVLGLAGGSLWLFAISTFVAGGSLFLVATLSARVGLVLVLVLGGCLIAVNIRVLRSALRQFLPLAPRTSEEKKIARMFRLVFGAEIVAIFAINWIGAVTHHVRLIAPLAITVVGLHFLPLGHIFRVPRYYATGIAMCVIALGGMWLIPWTAYVGHARAWYMVPGLLCSFVTGVTAVLGLRETMRFLRTTAAEASAT